MTENEKDVELLHTAPQQLIVKYQGLFRGIVVRYRTCGLLRGAEPDEILQVVNLEMLKKVESIRQHYDGRSFLRTYVAQAAVNACLKYARDQKKVEQVEMSDDITPVAPASVVAQLLIQETKEDFRTILRLFGRRLPKILLFLKICYRLPIAEHDVLSAYPRCRKQDLQPFMKQVRGEYTEATDAQLLEDLAPCFNGFERSSTTPDGYRRWMNERVLEICDLLNGDPPVSSFDRGTLRILVEDYFMPFLDTTA